MRNTQKAWYLVLYILLYGLLYWLFMRSIEWAFVVLAFIGAWYIMKGWGVDVDELFKHGEKRSVRQTILFSVVALIVAILIGFLASVAYA